MAIGSYTRAMREEVAPEHDHFRLLGQDNIRRYLPVRKLCVRVHPTDGFFDLRQVPQHRLPRVEVHGGDQQQPALLVLAGDGIQKRPIAFLLHDLPQGRIVGQVVAGDCGEDRAFLYDVVGRDLGVKPLETTVLLASHGCARLPAVPREQGWAQLPPLVGCPKLC
jgi:hypothetical protein